MAFRSKETMKKLLKKVGEDNITRGVKEALSKNIPNNKVVMGRAKRGLFAGRHIQYGNQVSEDGGNNIRKGYHEKRGLSGRSDPARKEGAARKKHLAHVQAFKENVGWKLCVGDYVVVAVYTARSRRTWKPNVQEKRLFSYILDRHIRVHVTTHALRCIDKAGGIDEYLLKTPYHKMDTEMGLLWKAKIEKMYEELGKVEVSFFSPEDEAKFEQSFKEMKLDEKTARREFRRQLYGRSSTPEATSDPKDGESDGGGSGYGNSHSDHEQLVANA